VLHQISHDWQGMDGLVQEAPEYSGSGNPLAKFFGRGRWNNLKLREISRQHASQNIAHLITAKRRPHLALASVPFRLLQGSLEISGTIAPLFAKCRIRDIRLTTALNQTDFR